MAQAVPAKTALITGGSRGIGASTVLALAHRGYDVSFTYRNKATRAHEIVSQATLLGVRALALGCDITHAEERTQLFVQQQQWNSQLDVLILSASGGLEKDVLAIDSAYPKNLYCQREFYKLYIF